MKLETFFEKFELLAAAPGAVESMRELVLRLAVKGKLVEQRKRDGDARRIFPEGLPPEGDSRYEVPESWLWVRFAAVGEQRLGKMLDQRGNRGELKPYLRNTNVQWLEIRLNDVKELRLEPDELDEYRLLPGDLLICEGGEPGRCAIWRDADLEMYFQKAIHRVRPREGILPDYLAICLQVDARSGILARHFTGATIKHFTGRSLSEYSIALPPAAEQKRIVAKVDELMALCDRLEAQQQERKARHATLARASLAQFAEAPSPANLNSLFHRSYSIAPADLRKAILSLAVQGKLVPQDPEDEPATLILGRISRIREQSCQSQRANASKKRIRELDESHSTHDVPGTWAWCKLGQLVLEFRYGTSRKCTRKISGVPVLRIPNIQDGRIDSADLKFTEMPSSEYDELRLKDGDLLIVRSNGSADLVGRSAVASAQDERFAYAGYLVRARVPREEIFTPFLQMALSTPSVRDQVEGPIRTTSGVKNINTTELSNLVIPLPPLPEQRRILAKVDQLMAMVDALEAQLAASRATVANLLDAFVCELAAGSRKCDGAAVSDRRATLATLDRALHPTT